MRPRRVAQDRRLVSHYVKAARHQVDEEDPGRRVTPDDDIAALQVPMPVVPLVGGNNNLMTLAGEGRKSGGVAVS